MRTGSTTKTMPGMTWRLGCALLVLGVALLAWPCSAQTDFGAAAMERARLLHDADAQRLLAEHLKTEYCHAFEPIQAAWTVQKHWLKPNTTGYVMLDPKDHPSPEADWLVSLAYREGDREVKALWLTQAGEVTLEIDWRDGDYANRSWGADGKLLGYDFRPGRKMTAGLSRNSKDGSVSFFQGGDGVWKKFEEDGELESTHYIHDGQLYCANTLRGTTVFGMTNRGLKFYLPGISFTLLDGKETLNLAKGHEDWTREGDSVDLICVSEYFSLETGKLERFPPEELTKVPANSRNPYFSRRTYDPSWPTIYAERRAAAIESIRAYLVPIGQEALLKPFLDNK